MLGLRDKRTYSQIMRDELDEGFDHLWQAGAAAAAGLGSTLGPRWSQTKVVIAPPASRVKDAASQSWGSTVAAIAPMIEIARQEAGRRAEQVRNGKMTGKGMPMAGKAAGKGPRKSWLTFGALAAAGVAIGVAGTLIMRRRRRAQWDEYDAEAAVDLARDEGMLVGESDRIDPTIMSDGLRRPGAMDRSEEDTASPDGNRARSSKSSGS